MKIEMEIQGKKLNGNKWEKIGEDKMGFGGQLMDEPPYRKRSNFKAFWRFWHPPYQEIIRKNRNFTELYIWHKKLGPASLTFQTGKKFFGNRLVTKYHF